MKTSLVKITAVSLFAIVLVAVPAALRAVETTNVPAQDAASKHKRSEHATMPFHGKLSAIDTNAMTLTVGERTFAITSETRITKDNLPATLADGVVGEMVGGAYKKNADGKLSATNLRFGLPAGGNNSEGAKPKTKKPAPESATSSTNSAAN